MPRGTAELFLKLEQEPLLRPFVLIGGTALALYLGHRKSEDLDFITTSEKLPRVSLAVFMERLQNAGSTVTPNDSVEAYDDFLNAGMELADYSQTVIVGGAVNMTFFAADAHHRKILTQEASESFGPRIASLLELSQLKALVACTRSNSRDWLDLYTLEKEHGFSLREWKLAYESAGLPEISFENALNRVCSGVTSANDPGFASLLSNPPTTEEIAEHFRNLRATYEVEMARSTLGGDPM